MSVSWNATENKRYTARLKLEALDRSGIFSDVAQAILAGDGGMTGVKASVVGGNLARMKIEVRVKNVEHLYSIVAKLNAVKGMLDVSRG